MGVKNICCAAVVALDLLAAACSIAADDDFAEPWIIYLLLAAALAIWGIGAAQSAWKKRATG